MAKNLLAVDLSYQCYRHSAAHKMLTSGDIFTGGLYGFMTSLAYAIRETKATQVVIGQDRKPYVRSREYPQYKEIRKKNQDDELLALHKESMPLILEFCEVVGLPVWGVDGFEFDDLVAHCVMKYRSRFDWIYAASNDSDLYQLLWHPQFAVFKKDMKDGLMTGDLLGAEIGLTPSEFMLATALQGTHNDIEGIRGIGEVTARNAVRDPGQLRRLMDGHKDLIERNLRLIQLPHAEFPHREKLPRANGSFSARELYRWAGRFDIEVTKTMLDSFERVNP